MEDVDFALEAIRVKDKATAAAYGSLIFSLSMYVVCTILCVCMRSEYTFVLLVLQYVCVCIHANLFKGVLDGHGGKQCAEFALDDLPSQIMSCLRNGSTYPDALYSSFLKTDKVLLIAKY